MHGVFPTSAKRHPSRLLLGWFGSRPKRGRGTAAARLVVAALFFLASAGAALAVDTGIGRAAAAVANVDPASAVVGSTEIRSYPGQEGDSGMVQVFRLQGGQASNSEPPVATVNGTYAISLLTPLGSGESLYVEHVGKHAKSATAVVQSAAAPSISGPLAPGSTVVVGRASPNRAVVIQDALSGVTLGTAGPTGGNGAFSAAVPALRLFQTLRAVDDDDRVSATLTVLGFSAVSNAGVPPATCPATVLQVAGPAIVRYQCELLYPRGIAVLPDGSLRVMAGVPPSGLINFPPPATIRFDPGTQEASLVAPVTGVGAAFMASSGSVLIARPRLFRLRDEHMVERSDGEILQMDPNTDETTVATRLLDIAPTGIAVDSSPTAAFGGGAVVSGLFYDHDTSLPLYPSGPLAPAPSALWSASLTGVAPLVIDASAPLVRLQGLVVGEDWDAAPALFATQPGSGTVFRILRSNTGTYTAAPLATGLGSPVEVALAPPGSPFGSDLYATDADGGRILRITVGAGNASVVQVYASGLSQPFGLAFGNTSLFVTEYSGSVVAITP